MWSSNIRSSNAWLLNERSLNIRSLNVWYWMKDYQNARNERYPRNKKSNARLNIRLLNARYYANSDRI